jgi:iron(III) transport system substrate-binding protein
VLQEFGDKFGLETGNQSFNSSSIWGRKVAEERAAGIYSFDVAMIGPGSALRKYKSKNYWQPYRELLIRPDVLGDENWSSGFEEGWVDDTKELCYSTDLTVTHVIGVDTNVVKEGEIKGALDLLNPKWRGRIIFADPRSGDIRLAMTAIRLNHGDEIARRILTETEPIFNREARAIVENVVRGKYAIGLGMRFTSVKEFVDLGVADNLKLLDLRDVDFVGRLSLFMFSKAPHPKAAQLFVNWLLSKEGQESYSKNTAGNSPRADVPPANPGAYPKSLSEYKVTNIESNFPDLVKTDELVAEWLNLKAG